MLLPPSLPLPQSMPPPLPVAYVLCKSILSFPERIFLCRFYERVLSSRNKREVEGADGREGEGEAELVAKREKQTDTEAEVEAEPKAEKEAESQLSAELKAEKKAETANEEAEAQGELEEGGRIADRGRG